MNAITNFLQAVLASFIAAILLELLRKKSGWFPSPSDEPIPIKPEMSVFDQRESNRQKLNLTLFNVIFFGYTFFIIYIALLFPPMVGKFFNNSTILLSDAKYIGHFLPPVEIQSSIVQSYFIGLTFLIYIPIFLLVHILSIPISRVVNKFLPITIYRWRAIQGFLFIIFATLLAIISIHIFSDNSIKNAFYIMFFFLLFVIGAGVNDKR